MLQGGSVITLVLLFASTTFATGNVQVSPDVITAGICNTEKTALRCSGKLIGYYSDGRRAAVNVDTVVEAGQCEWMFLYPKSDKTFVSGEKFIYCNSLTA